MEMSYRQPGPQNVIQTYSGLVMNGLVPNGLVPNGLDPNGLGNGEPERAEMGAKRPISASVKKHDFGRPFVWPFLQGG